MSTKKHILPNEIKQLQEKAVWRAAESVGEPIGLYEEWPNEEPALIVTENTGKNGPSFCRAVWQINDDKTNCILDHQYRAQISSQQSIPESISECWLGVHNVVCHLKENSSNITLLGGAFHVKELKNAALKKLNDYTKSMTKEQKDELVNLWNDMPDFDNSQVKSVTFKQLELAGLWYMFMITELSRFRYEENQASHDLLIFLQSLLGNIETLSIELKRSQNIGKKWDARFEEIMKQCEAYSEILGTRLGNLGNPEFNYYPIGNVVYDCVELHRSKATKKWIDIQVKLEKILDNKEQLRSPEIRMAKDYLSRAFHNILDNAIKYSYSGTAEQPREVIIIGKLQTIKNILGYNITVTNSGIGIENDEIEKVFELGYQGRQRTGEMRPGFGVGLSFVKECIDMHDGTISIESQRLTDGRWPTTVNVWLPLYGPRKGI